jgi:BirA family biotin operon repressor/biotin-[acetyl-CoA-carboxylase] ligase
MGLNRTLSPHFIKQSIETELELRLRHFPPSAAREILRFGGHVGSQIDWYNELDRGMELARRKVEGFEKSGRSFPSGSVIIADSLTGGRGRFARAWHAPRGGVWLTLVLANTLLPRYVNFLPFAAGIACSETLTAYGVDCRLKWVNDVHVGGRKIAGILIESFRSSIYGEEYLLIGVGVNVNNISFPKPLTEVSTSIGLLLGKEIDLTDFVFCFLAKLAWNIGLLYYEERRDLATGEKDGFSNIILKRYRDLSDTIGKRVLYGFDIQQNPQYEATVLDIDDQGCLVMRLQDNDAVLREQSGEILYLS